MLKSSAVAAAAAVVLLKVLGCRLTYFLGQAETSAEAWFNIALRPWKPEGSLGRTAQAGHLDSHTAPELGAKEHIRDNRNYAENGVNLMYGQSSLLRFFCPDMTLR